MMDRYGFHVELIDQVSTTMHGSAEGHMAYIYRRKGKLMTRDKKMNNKITCDPRFSDAYALVNKGSDHIRNVVKQQLRETLTTTRPKRGQRQILDRHE